MFRSFEEIEEFVLRNRRTRVRIALAAAQDEPALSALVEAQRKGIARGVLIGREGEIRALLAEMGEKAEDYAILDCPDEAACAALATKLIHRGEADVMMKGILPTATFVRAILSHENGLVPPGGLISQAAVFPHEGRLVVFTDCAVNIAPDLAAKRRILENVLPVTAALGMERPKVAVLSAVETVSPKIVEHRGRRGAGEGGRGELRHPGPPGPGRSHLPLPRGAQGHHGPGGRARRTCS